MISPHLETLYTELLKNKSKVSNIKKTEYGYEVKIASKAIPFMRRGTSHGVYIRLFEDHDRIDKFDEITLYWTDP